MAISHLFTVTYWSLNSSCLCRFNFCDPLVNSDIIHVLCSLFWFLPSGIYIANSSGWNPIVQYHPTPCIYLSRVSAYISVFNSLRFVNGIERVVVVDYCVVHYCLTVYSQYYMASFVLISRYDNSGPRSMSVYYCG